MLEIFTGVLIGVAFGFIVGIVPGLHANLIASLILAYNGLLVGFSDLLIASALISMAISANFFEFLKTMVFGMPDESNVISNYPIHEMLENRRGLEAVELIALGCLGSVLIAILLLPIEIKAVPLIYSKIKNFVPFILFFVALHLTFRSGNIVKSGVVFLLSGLLGAYTFGMEINDPFLPMLSGLFGLSMIFKSGNRNLPKQFEKVAKEFERKELIKSMSLGFISASTLSFIPAIGPAQASLLSEELRKKKTSDSKNVIATVAGVNTADVFFSLLTLQTIDKARSGVLVALSELVDVAKIFDYLIFGLIISAVISFLVFRIIAGVIVKNMHKFNMKYVYIIASIILASIVYAVDGLAGWWILMLSFLVGAFTNKLKVRNSQMMGCLILPTLMFYF